ncbi:uncharacterized protein J3R85_020951 [Psidium guajava]|nr:uncharacterized protein J3R85_020951 [Psidium guajava]
MPNNGEFGLDQSWIIEPNGWTSSSAAARTSSRGYWTASQSYVAVAGQRHEAVHECRGWHTLEYLWRTRRRNSLGQIPSLIPVFALKFSE